MPKIPSIILRIIIVLSAGLSVLAGIFLLPKCGAAIAEALPQLAFWRYPIVAGLYGMVACFLFALLQFWLLLNGIGRNGTLEAKRLKAIKFSAVTFAILYFFCLMPIIVLAAEADDAPGLVLLGAFLNSFPIGVAAVAAILERSLGK
ncbi:MAG: DUF2975 domain-containing protein [Clostridiales bacterium]